jgi:O-acetyl-ADP-ribose deacetylase (regulator of RNase III)
MHIIFVSTNQKFIDLAKGAGFDAECVSIEKWKSHKMVRITFVVSPANSLGFMDGGIDMVLSRDVFPGIEQKVKNAIAKYGKKTTLDRDYLPIGSSIIIKPASCCGFIKNPYLMVAPTMLLPQDVSETENAYFHTMAVLNNILHLKELPRGNEGVDVIFTSACCGYGKMSEKIAFEQIQKGIDDYPKYAEKYSIQFPANGVLICEPNLQQQPKYYMNSEFMCEKKMIVKLLAIISFKFHSSHHNSSTISPASPSTKPNRLN